MDNRDCGSRAGASRAHHRLPVGFHRVLYTMLTPQASLWRHVVSIDSPGRTPDSAPLQSRTSINRS